jgi:serine/threonine-protein kinase
VTAHAIDLAHALRDRYRLERELGAGGMATVYLAEDVKHHRKVALKVLRLELSAAIGAARFLREIQTTANLNHPHILPLHDSGEVLGTAFYVMPYVEGESLRTRLNREKQLAIDETVRIAGEVASALDYAHRKGVIHRDIKPENILLHDGRALVVDFGIALATAAVGGGKRMTETGLSLGTPNYMSPEQAMGDREITARSDIYALGATVYEMLTGEPPISGSTAQAVIARVVTETPRPLAPQRPTIPPHVEAAVLRALQKVPADRFASAGELAQALQTGGTATPTVVAAAPIRTRPWLGWLAGAGALALLVGGLTYYRSGADPAPRALVAALLPPPGCDFAPVEEGNIIQLSPDGRSLAFAATCESEVALWVKRLETGDARRLGGTAEAAYPFWSPDGRSLGFFAADSLKRIDLASGAIRNLAAASNGRGGTWSQSGIIVYAPDVYGPLYQVSAAGGEPRPATAIADSSGGVSHRLPHFLPDGRRFVFTRGTAEVVPGELFAAELGSAETRKLLQGASNAAYAEGHLLFARDGVLLAQPFDPKATVLSGSAIAITPVIESFDFRYVASFSTAPGDRMVYREPPGAERRMEWFDPATGARVSVADPGAYGAARVSPDGRRILASRPAGRGRLVNVWLYDPAQATWSRVSPDSRLEYAFAWSPDGREAVLQPSFDSLTRFVSLATGQSRAVRREVTDNPILDWAPDGSYAVGRRQVAGTGFDLVRWTPKSPGSVPEPLLVTPADEIDPRISPDGRYLAYLSDQSGRSELYLARLPGVTRPVQVSTGGVARTNLSGAHGWSADGRGVYYLDRTGTLMAVPVSTSPELRVGKAAVVTSAPRNVRSIDAARDGRLLLLYDERQSQAPVTLVDGWTARLERR